MAVCTRRESEKKETGIGDHYGGQHPLDLQEEEEAYNKQHLV